MQLQFTIGQNHFVVFFMFSETTDEFGQLERSAPSVFVRPRLKSENDFFTICLGRAESG